LFFYNAVIIFIFFSSAYCFNYDWMNYRSFYEYTMDGSFFNNVVNSGFEPGYIAVSMFCDMLSLDYQWVMICCHAIIMYCIVCTIGKMYNKNLALFIFFSFCGFYLIAEQIRQAVALSIGFLGYSRLRNGSVVKFYIYVTVAMLFHISAVFLFIFHFLDKKFYYRRKPLLLFLLLFVGSILPLVFTLILQHPEWFSFYPLLMRKLSYYSESELANNSAIFTLGLIPNIILISLCLYSFAKDKFFKSSQQAILAAAFIIQSKVVALFYRFSNYGVYYLIYSFDDHLHGRPRNHLFQVLIVACTLLFALKPFSTELYRDSVMDYHFYWLSSKSEISNIKIKRCDALYRAYPLSPYTLGTCK